MKRLLLLILPVLLLSCSDDGGTGPDTPTPLRDLTAGERAVLRSSADFGLTLFRAVADADPEANVFLSPLSVSMALSMAANGAEGETWTGMRDALRYGILSRTEMNQSCRGLLDLLRSTDPAVRLDIANSIWSREGFPVLQSFIDSNAYYFDAEIRTLDFSRTDAADIINAWVSGKTQGKIPDIVSAPIPDLVMMYLINAVYFKGSWARQFDPKFTRDDVFQSPGGVQRPVKMMNRDGSLRYHRDALAEIADLPYGWDRFAMAVLLPREGKTLKDLRDALQTEAWEGWLDALKETEMNLQLPRFSLEYEKGLGDVLAALGMDAAFDPQRADFSGINTDRELYISEVKHKTFVRVDEEGTEAAAATSVEMGTTSVPPVMRVDRPFIFVIHERHSGAILFIGQMTVPEE